MSATTGKPVIGAAANPYAVFGLEPTTEKPTKPGWYIVRYTWGSTSLVCIEAYDGTLCLRATDRRIRDIDYFLYWLGPLPEVDFGK